MANKKKTEKKEKMKSLKETIEIPSNIEFKVENNLIVLSKDGKTLNRRFPEDIIVSKEDNKLVLTMIRARKTERRVAKTIIGHVKNMIDGLTNGFEYELEICNVHFPITVNYDKAKKEFIIKNVLGEKTPRIISSFGNVEVEVKAPKIKIKSYDLEAAGQTSANLEKVTRIRYRDRNKFQDGIFITKKPGVDFT